MSNVLLEQGLYAFLTNDAAVSAQITLPGAAPRMLPQRMMQAAIYPYITYRRLATVRLQTLRGKSALNQVRMELMAYSSSYAQAKLLGDMIRCATGGSKGHPRAGMPATFDGFQGLMDTTEIQRCYLEDDQDQYDTPQLADELGVQHVRLEAIIWCVETLGTYAADGTFTPSN